MTEGGEHPLGTKKPGVRWWQLSKGHHQETARSQNPGASVINKHLLDIW